MYVSVVFVIRCLLSAVSLTLIKEQRFIRIAIIIILHYYYSAYQPYALPLGQAGSHNNNARLNGHFYTVLTSASEQTDYTPVVCYILISGTVA